jgi:hypothetical protein
VSPPRQSARASNSPTAPYRSPGGSVSPVISPHRKPEQQSNAPVYLTQQRGAAVGGEPVGGELRHHIAPHSERRQLLIQYISGRTGLITRPQLIRRTKLLNQLTNRLFPVGNRPQ